MHWSHATYCQMRLTAAFQRRPALRLIAIAMSTLVIGVLIVVGGMVVQQRQQADIAALSDSELVRSADSTPEAQAFHDRYRDAVLTIDRSGRVAVDYRSATAGAGVRLRLFIEPGPAVREGFLECTRGALITSNIAGAIRSNACGS